MTAVDQCTATLRSAILDGSWAAGERLPPERQLAERLAVDRTTLRAALGRLVSARLLSVRQGSGYVVLDYRRTAGLDVLPDLVRARPAELARMIGDVLVVRRRLAARVLARVLEEDASLDGIERAVGAFAAAAERGEGPEALARCDVEVTAALLEASGSTVLGLCLNPVSQLLLQIEPLRELLYVEPLDNAAAYRGMLSILRSRIPGALEPILAELARRDARALERHRAS